MIRTALAACALAVTGLAFAPSAAYAGEMKTKDKGSHKADKPDIVETAAAAGTFKTLLAAAEAAGLVDALKGDGPLTVLAPNDKAFEKLGDDAIKDLLKPDNKDQLVAILTYHVIAGKVKAKDALQAGEAETLQGSTVTFTAESSEGSTQAKVNGVNIIATDIKTSNGIIHVIDTVLMPPTE